MSDPVITTRWTADGLLFLKAINIGMAMAIKDGLIVPVIHNANKKSIIRIAKDRTALIDKGRGGKLGPAEMTGGTFTVSAMGMFGTELFTRHYQSAGKRDPWRGRYYRQAGCSQQTDRHQADDEPVADL